MNHPSQDQLQAEADERNHRNFMRHGKLPSKYWVVRDGKLGRVWRTKELSGARGGPEADASRIKLARQWLSVARGEPEQRSLFEAEENG